VQSGEISKGAHDKPTLSHQKNVTQSFKC